MTESRYKAIVNGLLMMGAGTVLALHSAGRFDARLLIPWWPLVFLIPAGGALTRNDGWMRGWSGAALWVTVSLVTLAYVQGYLALRPVTFAAIVLVAVGARVIWQGLAPASPRERRR